MKRFILALIIILILFSGCTLNSNQKTITDTDVENIKADLEQDLTNEFNKEKENQIEFFKKYSAALMDIQTGIEEYNLGEANLDAVIDSATAGDYEYYNLEEVGIVAQEQFLKSEEFFEGARVRLNSVKNKSPNSFFRKEVDLRLIQINLRIQLEDVSYKQAKAILDELNEINFGDEEKASEINTMHNEVLIPNFNNILMKISDAENNIDLHWSEDWYLKALE